MISCSFSTFNKANPAPLMLEYDFQPVVTSFASVALIMMIMMRMISDSTGLNCSVLPCQSVPKWL